MTDLDLLIDLHLSNDRQGPGDDAETQRAIDLARLHSRHLDLRTPIEVADIGCGTGAASLVLAQALDARITAIDAAEPFIKRLNERVIAAGLADRIEGHTGDMTALPFADARFDLIWSEGAIYNMGFAAGIHAWKRHLRPGGVLAVSELTWTTATRPAEINDHWKREYPGITTLSANTRALEDAGYTPLATFFIPPEAWAVNYYAPLRAGFPAFLDRHAYSPDAERIIAAEKAEIEVFQRYGAWYGYAFYIARVRE
jgi:SAM-dependent methyltransferase